MSVRLLSVRHALSAILAVALFVPASVAAQERVWVDVNVGASMPADDSFSSSLTRDIYGEPATFAVDYSAPTGPMFDIGAGFMLTPRFGIGIGVSRSSHKDFPVLSADIPHPLIADLYGSTIADGDTKLERTETALHLQAVFVAMESDTQRVRVFVGPSRIQAKNELVGDFNWEQTVTSTTNTVDITTYDITECACAGWGFNLGVDYAYFFSPTVGVGGVARFTRAGIEPVDFAGEKLDLTAGGFHIGAGLRVKF